MSARQRQRETERERDTHTQREREKERERVSERERIRERAFLTTCIEGSIDSTLSEIIGSLFGGTPASELSTEYIIILGEYTFYKELVLI